MDFYRFGTSLEYKTKQEIAYDKIKDAIIKCVIAPGEPLIIRSLAVMLNISESPVREALKRLISENFVIKQNSNLYAAPISAEEFMAMLEVRLDLEKIAIKISAKKMDSQKIEYLESLLNDMRCYYNSGDLEEYITAHNKFHMESCMMCGVSYLSSAVKEAFEHHERGRRYFGLELWKGHPSFTMHEKILTALKDKDPEKAAEYLTENTEKAFDLYKAQVRKIMEGNKL